MKEKTYKFTYSSLLSLLKEYSDLERSEDIKKGHKLEDILYKKILDHESVNTELIIRDRSVTLNQIKETLPKLSEDSKYYQNRVIRYYDNDEANRQISAIFVEDNFFYFVAIKKNLSNLDTNNIKGIYNKLLEAVTIESNNIDGFTVKMMMVSLDESTNGLREKCKLTHKHKRNNSLELIGGLDFCERIGLNYSDVKSYVENEQDLDELTRNMIENYIS